MGNYLIYSDISADINKDLMKKYDVRFIPMNYSVGEEDRMCCKMEEDTVLDKFYDAQRNGDLTHTSQISPQTYIDVFEPILKEGSSILYLSLSSGISGTYNSSLIAASELNGEGYKGKVVCVDTLSATGGIGLLLEAAGKNRENGMSIEENAEALEQNRLNVCHWFMVEDLMYLKRGGRISAGTALVGTALNIKPVLKIEPDGSLKNFTKVRGSKAALDKLVELYAGASAKEKGESVYVIHAGSKEKAEYLEAEVKKINPESEVTKVFLNPIIGAHVGPGMCAIAHIGKR